MISVATYMSSIVLGVVILTNFQVIMLFIFCQVFKYNQKLNYFKKLITLPTALLSQVGALENVTSLIGRMSNDPGLSTRGKYGDICLSVCALEHGLHGGANLEEGCTPKESSCFMCALVCHLVNTVLFLFDFSCTH